MSTILKALDRQRREDKPPTGAERTLPMPPSLEEKEDTLPMPRRGKVPRLSMAVGLLTILLATGLFYLWPGDLPQAEKAPAPPAPPAAVPAASPVPAPVQASPVRQPPPAGREESPPPVVPPPRVGKTADGYQQRLMARIVGIRSGCRFEARGGDGATIQARLAGIVCEEESHPTGRLVRRTMTRLTFTKTFELGLIARQEDEWLSDLFLEEGTTLNQRLVAEGLARRTDSPSSK